MSANAELIIGATMPVIAAVITTAIVGTVIATKITTERMTELQSG